MFPELHAVLKLDQKDLHGTYVNVLEETEQSGSFLVHHFLSHSLKSGKSIVFLGLEHSLGHYHAVGMKLGNNLQKAKEAGQIAFIEGLKLTSEAYGEESSDFDDDKPQTEFSFVSSKNLADPLKKLYFYIRETACSLQAKNSGSELVIIVDKLSLFQTLGVSTHDLTVFTKYLHQLILEISASLVTLARVDPEDEESDELANYLLNNCDLSVWTWPLKTGKSSSVSGNMKFRWLERFESGRYQFSVEDKNVKVFALGASNAVL